MCWYRCMQHEKQQNDKTQQINRSTCETSNYACLRRIPISAACLLPHSFIHLFSDHATATMRSFAAAAAAAAAVLSTASAFAPQAHKSPLSTAVSAPATSNVVLRQASEEVDPLDISPEVRKRCRMSHVLTGNG